MKKSELKQMIREEMQNLNESYESKELYKVAKNHDWEYKMSVKFWNSNGEKTKTLSISKDVFNKILALL
jgi:hypothetical protein